MKKIVGDPEANAIDSALLLEVNDHFIFLLDAPALAPFELTDVCHRPVKVGVGRVSVKQHKSV